MPYFIQVGNRIVRNNLTDEQARRLINNGTYEGGKIGRDPDVYYDVVNRSTNTIVASNVLESEAKRYQSEGGDALIRRPHSDEAPNYSYTESVHYAKPTSTFVEDVSTGKNVPYEESRQAQIDQNIAKAQSEGYLKGESAQSVRNQLYGQAQAQRKQSDPFSRIDEIREQDRANDVAQQAVEEVTAGGILGKFRELPENYQTGENLRIMGEGSLSRQKERAFEPIDEFRESKARKPLEEEDYAADLFRRQGKSVEVSDKMLEVRSEGRKTVIDYGTGEVNPFVMEGPDTFEYSKGFEKGIGTGEFPWYSKGPVGKAWAWERGVKAKSLKTNEDIGLEYGTFSGTMGISDRDSNNGISPMVVQGRQEEKSAFEGFIFGDPQGPGLKGVFVDFPVSIVRGIGKVLYVGNYPYGKNSKQTFDFGQDKFLKSKGPLIYDPDVLNAALIGGFIASPAAIAKLGYAGFTALSGYQFFKNPSGGSGGAFVGMAGLPLLSKLPKFSFDILEVKAEPGIERVSPKQNLIDLERTSKRVPVMTEEILPEDISINTPNEPTLELPELNKADTPLQQPGKAPKFLDEVKPQTKRPAKLPGIEKISRDFDISPKAASMDTLNPTTGADFTGLVKIGSEPKPLTKKGNIIFEELGIEEAGILRPEKVSRKMGIIFSSKTTGDISTYSFSKTMGEIEKVATTDKFGTVQNLDFRRPINVSRYKGRASPEQFLVSEYYKGKLNYIEGEKAYKILKPLGYSAGYYPKSKAIAYSDKLSFRIGMSKQEILAHELVHYKTPEFILKKSYYFQDLFEKGIIPYKAIPAETIAYSLQGYFGKYGFKVNYPVPKDVMVGSGAVRLEGPLRFEYPRSKVLEKSFGKNTPQVSISKDTFQEGNKIFEMRSVQIGRNVYGSIRRRGMFGNEDIIFKKSGKNIDLTYLNLNGEVKYTKSIKNRPLNIKFSQKHSVQTKDYGSLNFDIGYKEGAELSEAASFSQRSIQRTGKYRIFAAETQRRGFRELNQKFYGEAVTSLKQRDIASFQEEIYGRGKEKTFILKRPNLNYAIQPKPKSNVKVYSTEAGDEGILPTFKYIKRPGILTDRIMQSSGYSKYHYDVSRPKPLKAAYSYLSEAEMFRSKKGQFSFSQFQNKVKGSVDVELERPRIKLSRPSRQPILTADEIGEIMGRGKSSAAIPMFASGSRNRQSAYPKSFSSFRLDDFVLPKSKSSIDVKLYPREASVPTTRSFYALFNEIRPALNSKSRSDLNTRTFEKLQLNTKADLQLDLMVKTPSRSRNPNRSFYKTPQPYTPRTPPPFKFRDYSFGTRSKKNQAYGYFYREYRMFDFAYDFLKPRRRKRK